MSTTRFVLLIAGAVAVAGAPLGYRTGLLPVNAALGLLLWAYCCRSGCWRRAC